MSFQIIGTGRAHPEFVLDNEMLSKVVDTNDEWIVTRTGINTRYVVPMKQLRSCQLKPQKL